MTKTIRNIIILTLSFWMITSFTYSPSHSVTFPYLFFENNSTNFADFYEPTEEIKDTTKIIQWSIEAINEYPEYGLEVIGSCNFNEINTDSLSIQRARKVATLLVQMGLNQDRVTFKGLGTTIPIITQEHIDKLPDNEKDAAYQYNRHVSFLIIKI